MKKQILSIMLALCIVLSIAPAAVFAEGSTAPADITGSGASDDPYLIYTAAGLKAFRDKVNGQNGLTKQPGAHAKLMNDIVLNDGTFDKDGNYTKGESGKDAEKWTPIGYFKDDSDRSRYAGTFDGNGHTVKGLYVKGVEYAGLFGYAMNATIKNVTVDGYISNSVDYNYSGGIAGYLSGGSVTGCINFCTINTTGCAGGIVGLIEQSGQITDCGNAGAISGKSYKGGIAGGTENRYTTIQNCYNIGAIISDKSRFAGGIVGCHGNGWIRNCYWPKGTAEGVALYYDGHWDASTSDKSKTEFANGTVLELLKNNRTDSPWTKTGYLAAAKMTLPLLSWQTGDTFPIYTAEDLETFRDMVNSGESGANAKLMNDIDLGEEEWLPIGSESAPYAGSFDGQGYTVNALKIMVADCAGLFGCTDGATIKNVTVIGKIETAVNAYKADEEYVVYAGGIVGRAANTRIENCTNEVRLYASMGNDYVNKDYTAYAGGIAGYTSGSTVIVGCTNSGRVLSDSYRASAYAGGMTGYAQNGVTIENCLNNAYVYATTSRNSTLPDGSEFDNIMAVARAGGMVGVADDDVSVTGCYNTGEVSTLANGDYPGQSHAGGIVGSAAAQLGNVTIANCGNAANIQALGNGSGTRVGGIAGELGAWGGCVLTISNCYSTGIISASNDNGPAYASAGGIAGLSYGSGGVTISNCYWLTGSCDKAVGNIQGSATITSAAHSKNDFATGFVQSKFDAASAWTNRGYLKAAGLTLPLLAWQTADTHEHSEKTGNCLDGIYCECGYLMHMATSEHHWGEWVHNLTSHSRTCNNPGCGVTQSGNCSGGTATCTEQAICEVCHEKYGNKDPNNHTDIAEWVQTETKHTQKYKCCGAVTVTEEDHEWENGVCSECGYGCRHDYEWQSENGQYWQKCKFCDHETAKKDIPTINISGADKVCRTQDYKFSFTLPEGATNAEYGYEFIGLGDGPLTPTFEGGMYCGVIKSAAYPAEETGFKLIVSAKTADGFEFSAEKTVAIQNEHTGGTATCTDKAICEICGESYGELDVSNHADMKHIDAKAATKTAEGNIEYWYCEGCGKYFADKDGAKEITKADTVTAKLTEEKTTSPKTGDSSHLLLWISLLFISGSTITSTTVVRRKKKHFAR